MVREHADIDRILDDLGYTAGDLLNVSFVFIVEGKQDRNRLPLLLDKYYSEIYDENGMLQRIAIHIHQQLYQHKDLCQSKVYE